MDIQKSTMYITAMYEQSQTELKSDLNTSSETYERDQCMWKETYLKRLI